MLTVVYSPNGVAYSDFSVESEVLYIILCYQLGQCDEQCVVSTENAIYMFRAMVIRGHINNTDICFEFNGEIITVDKYCNMSHYPKGFNDTIDKLLDEIIDYKYNNVKENEI